MSTNLPRAWFLMIQNIHCYLWVWLWNCLFRCWRVPKKAAGMEICMSRASATIDFLSRYGNGKPRLLKENMNQEASINAISCSQTITNGARAVWLCQRHLRGEWLLFAPLNQILWIIMAKPRMYNSTRCFNVTQFERFVTLRLRREVLVCLWFLVRMHAEAARKSSRRPQLFI
jgi:hypothetical protein